MKENDAQLVGLALAALFFLPMALVTIGGAFVAGRTVVSGGVDAPLSLARMGFVYLWLGVVGFGGYRAYSVSLDPDNADGLLTTVSHRDLLGGIVLAELGLWTAFGFSVAGAAAVTFGAGAGSVLTVVSVLLALALTLVTGLVAGFTLALGVRNTGVRSVLFSRIRSVFGILLGIAYIWAILTNSLVSVFDPIYHALAGTPVAWLGDLAVLPLGVDASSLRVVGVVVAATGFLAVTVPAMARLAEWLWYADGISVSHEAERDAGTSRLAGVLPTAMLGVVSSDWTRARRSPLSLSFSIYPVFILFDPVLTTLQSGSVGRGLPVVILFCGIWITGTLFALNVLGHEGSALPVTLLTPRPARSLVAGHVLAGVIPMTTLTVLATGVTGLLSPHPLPIVATLVASAVLLTVGAGAIATGVGAMLPRFDAVRVSRSTKAIVPSTLAVVLYSVIVIGVSFPALVAHSATFGHAIAPLLGMSEPAVAAVGTIVSSVLTAGIGGVSVFYAIRTVDDYRLS